MSTTTRTLQHSAATARARNDLRSRAVVAVALVGAVMWASVAYSFRSISAGLDVTSPTMFVPFVPLAALAVAAQRWKGRPGEGHQFAVRSADWIVAVAMAVAAYVVAGLIPEVFATETLAWRADTVAIPLVAAVVVTVLFGVRMLWRVRASIWLLTLMTPALYRPILAPLRTFTSWSTGAVTEAIAATLPFVSETATNAGGPTITIAGPDGPVSLSVAQSCAGNGATLTAAFVAITICLLTTGTRRQKLTWALFSVALCWVGNLVRLLTIFGATSIMGSDAATGWVHDSAGIVILAITLAISLGTTRRFGLRMADATPVESPSAGLPALRVAGMIGLAVLLMPIAHANGTATARFDLDTGRSTVAIPSITGRLDLHPDTLGLTVARLPEVTWAAEYFGPGARWDRFLATDDGTALSIDVISTDDATRFDTYGLAACFGFHDWTVRTNRVVPLPGGRQGEQIVYSISSARGAAATGDKANRNRLMTVLSWRQLTTNGSTQRITLQRDITEERAGTGSLLDIARRLISSSER